jgi:uncharacterized protein YecE (DUF72 family)
VAESRARGSIRVGVGGWVYEPWRDNFYPPGLAHANELAYLSERVSAIEINATFYRNQSAASFAKWRDATPAGFVFSVKATRYATNRRVLAEAGEAIERFFASGIAELGAKLGPIVWQLAPTKAFDAADIDAFLVCCPRGSARCSCATRSRSATRAFARPSSLRSRAGTASRRCSRTPTSTRRSPTPPPTSSTRA